MTLHIKLKDYSCPQCQASYIPYKANMACPKCGFVDNYTSSYYHFMPRLIESMLVHKRRYGTYTPPAWFSGSVTDGIQLSCYHFYDQFESQKTQNFSSFLKNYLHKQFGPEDNPSKKYAEIILTAVNEELNGTQPLKNASLEKEPRRRRFSRKNNTEKMIFGTLFFGILISSLLMWRENKYHEGELYAFITILSLSLGFILSYILGYFEKED